MIDTKKYYHVKGDKKNASSCRISFTGFDKKKKQKKHIKHLQKKQKIYTKKTQTTTDDGNNDDEKGKVVVVTNPLQKQYVCLHV